MVEVYWHARGSEAQHKRRLAAADRPVSLYKSAHRTPSRRHFSTATMEASCLASRSFLELCSVRKVQGESTTLSGLKPPPSRMVSALSDRCYRERSTVQGARASRPELLTLSTRCQWLQLRQQYAARLHAHTEPVPRCCRAYAGC